MKSILKPTPTAIIPTRASVQTPSDNMSIHLLSGRESILTSAPLNPKSVKIESIAKSQSFRVTS